jgi:hypothetical protein
MEPCLAKNTARRNHQTPTSTNERKGRAAEREQLEAIIESSILDEPADVSLRIDIGPVKRLTTVMRIGAAQTVRMA